MGLEGGVKRPGSASKPNVRVNLVFGPTPASLFDHRPVALELHQGKGGSRKTTLNGLGVELAGSVSSCTRLGTAERVRRATQRGLGNVADCVVLIAWRSTSKVRRWSISAAYGVCADEGFPLRRASAAARVRARSGSCVAARRANSACASSRRRACPAGHRARWAA